MTILYFVYLYADNLPAVGYSWSDIVHCNILYKIGYLYCLVFTITEWCKQYVLLQSQCSTDTSSKGKIVQASKEVKEHNLIIQIIISETNLPQKLNTFISFLYMDVDT